MVIAGAALMRGTPSANFVERIDLSILVREFNRNRSKGKMMGATALAKKDDHKPEEEPIRPAGTRIDVATGRRINLAEQRELRKSRKARDEPASPRESYEQRMLRRAALQKESFKAREKVMRPRREAAALIENRAKDSPTPERLARAGEDYQISDHGTMQIKDQPLDRLYKNGKGGSITKRQYEAGDRFRSDFVHGGLRPLAASDPSASGGRVSPDQKWVAGFMPASVSQAAARGRWRLAEQKLAACRLDTVVQMVVIEPLQPEVTEIGGDYLVTVGRRMTGRGQPDQARAAVIELLKVALDVLADHYGLSDDSREEGGGQHSRFYRSFGALNSGPEDAYVIPGPKRKK